MGSAALFRAGIIMALLLPRLLQAAISTTQAANGTGISVNSNGSYDITFPAQGWRFGGDIGATLSNLAVFRDADALGEFAEISFDYSAGTPRRAAIRAYGRRSAVLFSVQYGRDTPNLAPFPTLSRYPALPYHLTYDGFFAIPSFPGYGAEGPWVFYDGLANGFVISPAANLLVASTSHGSKGEIVTGISPRIPTLPAGFTHRTLLVVESGINRAFDTWGRGLLDLVGKTPPPNDRDSILDRVGYWTDAGASYYYQTEPGMSYPETLTAVQAEFERNGIRLGYLQLDSWFYPKGPLADWRDGADGIYEYSAASSLFTPSLQAFQATLGIPLIAHARWIDTSSPVRQQYRMSGNVSIDPQYWDRVSGYLAGSGVAAYEQDWLGTEAHPDFNLADPYAFFDGMAAAMAAQGLNMQYCMATPAHFLQSTHYGNLTTIRTSEDRFDRSHWSNFLYTSRLASALGIWPFTDVFLSAETDNLLLATLSAGPVGVGDRLGTLNRDNLLRTARADGTIVKPDVPIVPTDRSFVEESQRLNGPLIASTFTDFDGLRAYYVFAFDRGAGTPASFRPAEIGIDRAIYAYDYFRGTGSTVGPYDFYTRPMTGGRVYTVLAPIGPSGIAVLGDLAQFVPLGKKRIAALRDDGVVHLTVLFAAGESSRIISGYAPASPAVSGIVGSIGKVAYDDATGRFTVEVTAGGDMTATIEIQP